MPPRTPSITIERAIKAYQRGTPSIASIAKRYGIGRSTLANYLGDRGLVRNRNAARHAQRVARCEQLRALFDRGMPIGEIAATVGMDVASVLHFRKRFKLGRINRPRFSHLVARLDAEGVSIGDIAQRLGLTREQVHKALHYRTRQPSTLGYTFRLPSLRGWWCPDCPTRCNSRAELADHKHAKHRGVA